MVENQLYLYKAINSTRFVEMVELSLFLFMYKYKRVCCQFL